MTTLSRSDADKLRNTLLDAAIKCSDRCLYQSAKWAAELADALPALANTDQSFATDIDLPMQDVDPAMSVPGSMFLNHNPEQAVLEAIELSRYVLAKAFFDCREFDRCSSVFLPPPQFHISQTSKSPADSRKSAPKATPKAANKDEDPKSTDDVLPDLSEKSLFLALYAKYMSGEKRKDEDSEMILGPADTGSSMNRELADLSRLLNAHFEVQGSNEPRAPSQGWLEYLYGVVLAKSRSEDDAKQWLIRSVHLAPFNWSAWLELSNLLNNAEDLRNLVSELPHNLMTLVFHIYASQELCQTTEEIHQSLSGLEQVFPGSQFLKTQRALLFYHSKDFEEAEQIFASILKSSPHRIDSLDHYSNILYVMANRPKLAHLAQMTIATDKFRPETCCVVGNYYSLKSEHEKAVMYFRRALTLDRTFLSAWTLMGHEFVEMKNTHAAIESYRRAVDVNRKDYRAWYGLGQTYEILEMHFYALFYFQRAASLRPHDAKMWQAMGQCYDKINRPMQSIKAYKRALVASTYYESDNSSFGSSAHQGEPQTGIMDPDILFQIALMHEKLEDEAEAAEYMELTLAQEEGQAQRDGEDEEDNGRTNDKMGGTGVTNTTSRARMWLAKWEAKRDGWQRAIELANELCQDGVEVEEAKALIRDMKARMEERNLRRQH